MPNPPYDRYGSASDGGRRVSGPTGNGSGRFSSSRGSRSSRGDGRTPAERMWDNMNKGPLSRRNVLLGIAGFAGALGLARLTDYQIISQDRYLGEADMRRLSSQTLFAKRGTFYDRNGNVLASSVECQNVYANPSLVTKPKHTAKRLAAILGLDVEDTYKKLKQDGTFVYIKRQVDDDDAKLIEDEELAGIEFEPAIKRVYPYGNLASQLLGVVNVDNEGVSGLESYYEKDLQGKNGSITRERALDGTLIAGGAYKKEPSQDGSDMILTIDADIQRAAEDAIAKAVEDTHAKSGSVLVCDPTTGEILAACSNPTYDQTDLANATNDAIPLRAVTDAYEPGSVFKAIVSAMGCDMGVLTPDTTFEVPANIKVGDDTVSDADKRDYGMTMTLREIMRRSSNVGMVLAGKEIGANKFASYLDKFKIKGSSGVDYPGESAGVIKDRDEYDGASLGAMSFGQALSLPPIRVLRAVAAIANEGKMTTPHFLKSRRGEDLDWTIDDEQVISKEAADAVCSMMQTVVEEGTAMPAQIPGYVVAGKTGTAQRADASGGYQENNYMSSFLGFIAPGDARAMVYVTLDGTPSGSTQALEPFVTVMQSCIDVLGIKPAS